MSAVSVSLPQPRTPVTYYVKSLSTTSESSPATLKSVVINDDADVNSSKGDKGVQIDLKA